eukprot:TRINITY_DN3788_c0_g1_i2.p1 TRINITY_DN3788_c0_g1~~TRINITY_DN3788_c0_g1_i2.p1  ORF type:complete len:819 (-),score=108.31 TRINITY_DN3788_c0_g1_i2:105-2561(-)
MSDESGEDAGSPFSSDFYPLLVRLQRVALAKSTKQAFVRITNTTTSEVVKTKKVFPAVVPTSELVDGIKCFFDFNVVLKLKVLLGHTLLLEVVSPSRVGGASVVASASLSLLLPENGPLSLILRGGKDKWVHERGRLSIDITWNPQLPSKSSHKKGKSSKGSEKNVDGEDSSSKGKTSLGKRANQLKRSISAVVSSSNKDVPESSSETEDAETNDYSRLRTSIGFEENEHGMFDPNSAELLMNHDSFLISSEGIEADVMEHNDLTLELVLSASPALFEVDNAAALSMGINPQLPLRIVLTFKGPSVYLSKLPEVSFYQWEEKDATKREKWVQIGVWWTLTESLKIALKKTWPAISKIGEKTTEMVQKIDARVCQTREILGMSSQNNVLLNLALRHCKNDVGEAVELLLQPSRLSFFQRTAKKEAGRIMKGMPPDSFLLKVIVDSVKSTFKNCTSICPICLKPHKLAFRRPMVCDDEFCQYRFVEMGLGANVENLITIDPETVDLLLSACAGAANGSHFTPFPSEVKTLFPNGKVNRSLRNNQEVVAVVSKIPSVKLMQKMVTNGSLRKDLEALDSLAYLLLRWVINSNRSHLEFIREPSKLVSKIPTNHQWVVQAMNPSKAHKFHEYKKKHGGSFWAFHGSNFSNWHSIFHNGLKNYSGTKHMSAGAAYGPGIYLGSLSSTSFGYASMNLGWCNSMFGTSLRLMALCEIIDYGAGASTCKGLVHRANCSHNKSSPHIRCEKNGFVVTRYFMLFDATQTDGGNVSAANLTATMERPQLSSYQSVPTRRQRNEKGSQGADGEGEEKVKVKIKKNIRNKKK